jgi:tRNA-splicing ligase RtcB
MAERAQFHGIALPDRELACAPIASELGRRYIAAMRAATNCALANPQIIGHLARQVFAQFFAHGELPLLFDVSHNTCKLDHQVEGVGKRLYIHRKGATRAFGQPSLPSPSRPAANPC